MSGDISITSTRRLDERYVEVSGEGGEGRGEKRRTTVKRSTFARGDEVN